jgi:hypothetical protein
MVLRKVVLWVLTLLSIAGLGLTAQAISYKSTKANIMEKCLKLGSSPENCGCLANFKIHERGLFGSFIMLGNDLSWLDADMADYSFCGC